MNNDNLFGRDKLIPICSALETLLSLFGLQQLAASWARLDSLGFKRYLAGQAALRIWKLAKPIQVDDATAYVTLTAPDSALEFCPLVVFDKLLALSTE
jgi:hypothetical protein